MNPHRSEVWLVDFGEPANPLNDSRAGVTIVVPLTTTHRGLPSHIEIDKRGSGLDELSYAKCEDVKSISEQRLIAQLGAVEEQVMFQIARALRFLLEL